MLQTVNSDTWVILFIAAILNDKWTFKRSVPKCQIVLGYRIWSVGICQNMKKLNFKILVKIISVELSDKVYPIRLLWGGGGGWWFKKDITVKECF